jgi:hypothetical protein
VIVDAEAAGDTLAEFARTHRTPLVALHERPVGTVELELPKVALLPDDANKVISEVSTGFARSVLTQRLGLAFDELTPGAIESGALQREDYDALVVPDGQLPQAALTPLGLLQLQRWVEDGGRFIGYRGRGVAVARAAGLTDAQTKNAPELVAPGIHLRLAVRGSSPLTWGFTDLTWAFDRDDPVLERDAQAVGLYPGDARFAAGYTEGADALRGTAAVLDETVGRGRALVFTFDPLFRSFTEADMRLFANALLYPLDAHRREFSPLAVPRAVDPAALAAAPPPHADSRIRVDLADADALPAAAATVALPPGSRIEFSLRGASPRVPNLAAHATRSRPPGSPRCSRHLRSEVAGRTSSFSDLRSFDSRSGFQLCTFGEVADKAGELLAVEERGGLGARVVAAPVRLRGSPKCDGDR